MKASGSGGWSSACVVGVPAAAAAGHAGVSPLASVEVVGSGPLDLGERRACAPRPTARRAC